MSNRIVAPVCAGAGLAVLFGVPFLLALAAGFGLLIAIEFVVNGLL